MSEIRRNWSPSSELSIGNNRSGEWRSLRLNIYRTSDLQLTVALITRTAGGVESLDGEIRGIQVPWDGANRRHDSRFYALRQALIGVTQTRP